uniref:AB hydrolase-1 domain-containing protein n=1 Tax=Compsopogon caeruleus TaxID=31354 RepID=A0A7S1TFG1_9RHOD|mmetsp:Transcript_4207/g.8193  ORF Transcript_4207/g.8193 Transcript_4207/m.8193 type:complete len:303 (+) Transcript_4207:147-1055(+)
MCDSTNWDLHSVRIGPKRQSVTEERNKVVFLHGLLGSVGTYRSLLRRQDFLPDHEIMAVDLRNHGGSPHLSGKMTIPELEADVVRWLRKREESSFNPGIAKGGDASTVLDQGHPPVTLLGHSLGGKVAMRLAMTSPHLVERLVVVDIAPRHYSLVGSCSAEAVHAMRMLDLRTLKSRVEADEGLKRLGVRDAGVRMFLLTNLVHDKSDVQTRFSWRVNIETINDSIEELHGFPEDVLLLPPFRKPTLFVRGENSNFVRSERDGDLIQRLFPNSAIKTVPHAGHWVQADAPDEFVRVVNEFLG